MRRLLLLVCSVALLSAWPLSAQEVSLPKQFRDWYQTSCSAKPPEFGFDKEAGEREFSMCQYKSGNSVVGIWVGRYHDPSSAFEVYTTRLRAGMVPTNLGQVSAFDKNGVVILEGTLVLESTANVSKDDLGALVKAMEAGSQKGPLPPIRTYLPRVGRVLGTERYALGPVALRAAMADENVGTYAAALLDDVGFANGAEAMLARYSSPGKGNGVLMLLEYPTPQLAEQQIHHLGGFVPPAKPGEQRIARKGSLLSIVLEASPAEYAANLREAVDYETQVTWNEASQTATDPPITSIMVKIFIGTGIFMVAAVVLGIAFGGVRVLTKKFFPGKVFDRQNQMEVLQLGLSGKRIDPSDFY
jgi:hypothetical protein